MPTYVYRCPECGTFEIFQKITDDPLRGCPECGRKVKKLVSGGVAILFKGSGFHTTDYRSEEYKKRAREEKNKATASSGSSDSKSKGKKAAS